MLFLLRNCKLFGLKNNINDNIDNFGEYIKEYPHAWCVNGKNEIVDPTYSQFILIGKLEYKELNENAIKCMGCGRYFIPIKKCGCKYSE